MICNRSIPACAGEPLSSTSVVTVTVYPRVCGGTRRAGFARRRIGSNAGEPQGSTEAWAEWVYPRVCGGTDLDHAVSTYPRSIPACAGEPAGDSGASNGSAVYPRVCGGTSICLNSLSTQGSIPACAGEPTMPRSCISSDNGLSPRVRGNLVQCMDWAGTLRSIPACAGEPRPAQGRCRASSVYPRVCGGTRKECRTTSLRLGLSPRVRGNLNEGGNL